MAAYDADKSYTLLEAAEIIKKVIKDLIRTNLILNSEISGTSINYEPFVYPVQFLDYKNETFKIKNFIENFNNLFSVGAGGEFNYADSQILFHKSFDLANNLDSKFNDFSNVRKNM